MDKDTNQLYKSQIAEGQRCQVWLNTDTTKDYLGILREKKERLEKFTAAELKKLKRCTDQTFRARVEARFLAAEEIEDFFNILQDKVNEIKSAQDSLKGKDVDEY